MVEFSDNSIYQQIGVKNFINAAGPKCSYGGTRMSNEVINAMSAAAQSFVSISELNKAIGKYIAEGTGAQAGMVTSGASSGIVLSAAACMTGTDLSKIRKLPDSSGMKNEIITQKIHRGSYSHMYTFSGAKLIEVGDVSSCLIEELENAINEKTAAITYLDAPRISQSGLDLNDVVKVGHRNKVPVIVDSAMLPPKDNMKKYIREGVDLVIFSGGKIIRGPQASGLLFGREDLIDAALANASPNQAIGRPHKVSKENMVGLYAALKIYMDSDEKKMLNDFRQILLPIQEALTSLSEIVVELIHDNINYPIPVLALYFNKDWSGPKGNELSKILFNDEPRVIMPYYKALDHLVINPMNLSQEEADFLATHLSSKFSSFLG